MEQTFMTIHNLTPDANILFASDSIYDILGYQPHEVQGKSCFEYFHPEEVPFARSVHSRGVLLDKAAVLHYARILSRDGQWVNCECCFTIVHDVLVACTSIYRRGEKSERRAMEAPAIRRIFSCSPRDPRYHMLEHLSPKFKMPPMEREPRAALILNRFTRNLSIMFATNAVSTILGVRPDEIKDKAFYECIQENCLQDAIQCLESAKANDSIAYLRFWFRDPRGEDVEDHEVDMGDGLYEEGEEDEEGGEAESNATSDSDGGAQLNSQMDLDSDHAAEVRVKEEGDYAMDDGVPGPSTFNSNSQPSSASGFPSQAETAYQTPLTAQSAAAARRVSPGLLGRPQRGQRRPRQSFELEAVVSCTSDGLVVVLRRARPPIPAPHPPLLPPLNFQNGLFAAPWGRDPIRPFYPPELLYHFRPPLLPQYMPLRENIKAAGGPPVDQLMRSIRDVAVFAWAIVGINGNIAAYSHGMPRGEAQPPDGLPVWDPHAGIQTYAGPENQAALRWAQMEKEQDGGHYDHHQLPDHHGNHRGAPYPYGQPRSWQPPASAYTTGGYEPRPYHQGAYPPPFGQQPPHAYEPQRPHPAPGGGRGLQGSARDAWLPPATLPAYSSSYAVPTTQAQSPSESSQPPRYPWQ